jgi:hypothetical protein
VEGRGYRAWIRGGLCGISLYIYDLEDLGLILKGV